MKSLVFILFLFCQFAFGQNKIAFRKSGTIFTENYHYIFFEDFKRFTPSFQEITELEKHLKNYPKIKSVKRLSKYYRQYVGYYNSLNERVILVNFLWKKDGRAIDMEGNEIEPWKEEWSEVFDGGNQYWKIKYNPDSKKFYDMIINGIS